MTDSFGPPMRRAVSVEACREQARRLLKSLRAGNTASAREVARRFRALSSFAERTDDELFAEGRVRLKHALTLVAVEAGFASWVDLLEGSLATEEQELSMWAPGMAALLNRWFADYEDARVSRAQLGGYLLPFRSQFFVTESEGILALGLDPDDPDWDRIGCDWVRPLDPDAYRRLSAQRRAVLARKV